MRKSIMCWGRKPLICFATGIEQNLEHYAWCGGKQKNMHCVNWCMHEVTLKGTEDTVQLVEYLSEALGSVSV